MVASESIGFELPSVAMRVVLSSSSTDVSNFK